MDITLFSTSGEGHAFELLSHFRWNNFLVLLHCRTKPRSGNSCKNIGIWNIERLKTYTLLSIEPERKDRLINKVLVYHVVEYGNSSSNCNCWESHSENAIKLKNRTFRDGNLR